MSCLRQIKTSYNQLTRHFCVCRLSTINIAHCVINPTTNRSRIISPTTISKNNKFAFNLVNSFCELRKNDNLVSIKDLEDVYNETGVSELSRIKKLEDLWEILTSSEVILEEAHFLLRLKCYLKCRTNVEPKIFMKEVKEAGVEVSQEMLRLLLKVVAEHGDPGFVSSVITSMKSRNYEVDDSVFACLIIAHAVRR